MPPVRIPPEIVSLLDRQAADRVEFIDRTVDLLVAKYGLRTAGLLALTTACCRAMRFGADQQKELERAADKIDKEEVAKWIDENTRWIY